MHILHIKIIKETFVLLLSTTRSQVTKKILEYFSIHSNQTPPPFKCITSISKIFSDM